MKRIIGVLTVLFLSGCKDQKDSEIESAVDLMVKSEIRTVFNQNSPKTYTTVYSYDSDGFLSSAVNEDLSIVFQKNESNLGSRTEAYVVAREISADAEVTRQYFCDESRRVLRELASDGTEKIFSYSTDGFLAQTVINNGVVSDTLDFVYNAPVSGSPLIRDMVMTSFRVEQPMNNWNFIGKTYTHYYYNSAASSLKGEVVYPFNYGKVRAEQLFKVVKMPFIEGTLEEYFYSFSFDKNGYITDKKVLRDGKYTEMVTYSYTAE